MDGSFFTNHMMPMHITLWRHSNVIASNWCHFCNRRCGLSRVRHNNRISDYMSLVHLPVSRFDTWDITSNDVKATLWRQSKLIKSNRCHFGMVCIDNLWLDTILGDLIAWPLVRYMRYDVKMTLWRHSNVITSNWRHNWNPWYWLPMIRHHTRTSSCIFIWP